MKINSKYFYSTVLLVFVISVLLFFLFSSFDFTSINIWIVVTFIINGLYIIFNIMKEEHPFSLNKCFWYFNLFFFFIGPLFQYLTNYYPWDVYFEDELYIESNIIILIAFFSYNFTKTFVLKRKNIIIKENTIDLNIGKVKTLFFISICSFVILVGLVGFKNLFFRGTSQVSTNFGGLNTILNIGLRSIPAYAFAYSYYFYKKHKKGLFYVYATLIMILLCNFPQALSRYMLGIIYIGLVLIVMKNKITGRKFDYLLLFIFLLVFPILQLFKYFTIDEIFNNLSMVSNRISSAYNNGDFDAYSILCRSIIYINNNGLQFGKQISSTLLFFIPRAIWKSKPYHSGIVIAEDAHQVFTNLSCPLIAEANIDFGIFGIIFYFILFSYIINYLDFIYWNSKNIERINLFYPFLFGCLIFLLRGALQPTFIYCFSFFIFYFIFIKKIIRKRRTI